MNTCSRAAEAFNAAPTAASWPGLTSRLPRRSATLPQNQEHTQGWATQRLAYAHRATRDLRGRCRQLSAAAPVGHPHLTEAASVAATPSSGSRVPPTSGTDRGSLSGLNGGAAGAARSPGVVQPLGAGPYHTPAA